MFFIPITHLIRPIIGVIAAHFRFLASSADLRVPAGLPRFDGEMVMLKNGVVFFYSTKR